MMRIRLFNKHALLLFCLSLGLNFIFLFFNRKNLFVDGLIKSHGEVAYNIYKYNSIKINPARMGELYKLESKTKQRADYYEIDHEKFGPPTAYRNYGDTIGYGVLIGLIWKITNSLNYLDIQILQILIFSFLMFLFYYIAFILFSSYIIAFLSGIALLLFFPIIYLNVQVFRDIWPYYASIILLFTQLRFLYNNKKWSQLFICGTLFALIQFMRPPIFLLLITTSIVLMLYSLCSSKLKLTHILKLSLTLFALNFIFFWIPFMTYNKIAYNQYLVGPTGVNFIQGIGEFPNKWGYKLSDGWYPNHMKEEIESLSEIERDNKAKDLFLSAVKEEPLYYLSCIIKRVPRLLFPGLPWFNYQDTKELYLMYVTGTPLSEIIKLIFRNPTITFDFVARHVYIGFYLLFAYLGIILALIRKKYFTVLILFCGIIFASYYVIFAHIDHRYLIPYYGLFSFFVGYFLCNILKIK